MSSLPFSKRNALEVWYPQSSNGTSLANGVSWAWSTITQIVASTTNEYLLCGAYVNWSAVASSSSDQNGYMVQFQIMKGAAASEVAIAQSGLGFNLNYTTGTGAQVIFGSTQLCRFSPVLVPAGTRLSLRASQNNSSVAAWTAIYLVGYEPNATGFPLERPFPNKLFYRKGGDTVQANVYPSLSSTSITLGATWAWGTAVEFITSAANDMIITALLVDRDAPLTSIAGQYEIGIGTAGSEEWLAWCGTPVKLVSNSLCGRLELLNPLYVKKGERVAVRGATGGTSQTVNIALCVDELL